MIQGVHCRAIIKTPWHDLPNKNELVGRNSIYNHRIRSRAKRYSLGEVLHERVHIGVPLVRHTIHYHLHQLMLGEPGLLHQLLPMAGREHSTRVGKANQVAIEVHGAVQTLE